MLELEIGIITRYDGGDDKKFGFLEVLNKDGQRTGEDIFFHFNDGQFVEVVDDDIQFVGREFRDAQTRETTLRIWHPHVGDKLAFQRAPGSNGRAKAYPWTYATMYSGRVFQLTAPYYRVLQITSGHRGRGHGTSVIWLGQGSDALSREYPVRVLDGKLNDPLADSVNYGEGSTVHYVFEEWFGEPPVTSDKGNKTFVNGNWASCDDPRFMSDHAKALRNPLSATH